MREALQRTIQVSQVCINLSFVLSALYLSLSLHSSRQRPARLYSLVFFLPKSKCYILIQLSHLLSFNPFPHNVISVSVLQFSPYLTAKSAPVSPTLQLGTAVEKHANYNGNSSSSIGRPGGGGGSADGGVTNSATSRPRPPPVVASHKPALATGPMNKKSPPPTAHNSPNPEPETPTEARQGRKFVSKSGLGEPSTSDASPSQPATPYSPDRKSSPQTPGGRHSPLYLDVNTPKSYPSEGGGSSAPNSPLFDQLEMPTPVRARAPFNFLVFWY